MWCPNVIEHRHDSAVARSAGTDDDGGFLLLEAIMAITVITIVMTALTALLVSVSTSANRQRDDQVAARIAVAALDRVRAVGAAGSVSGRDSSSVNSQLAHTPASADYPAALSSVQPWLATMTAASDSSAAAGSGPNAAVPTVAVQQQLNGETYSTSYFVGYCWLTPAQTSSDCGATQADGDIQYVRVVVVVAWKGGTCNSDLCDYVTASLLDGTGDPVFNFNQSAPSNPTLAAVSNQVSVLGQPVDGLPDASGCASPCRVSASGGAPPMIFTADGLPAGLSMDSTGLITGTPTTKGSSSVTVTVTDSFLDTDTVTFTWSVVESALTFDKPADQSSSAGDTVSLAMTGASGGLGAPYTWSMSGAPAGLTIDSGTGVISGTLARDSGSADPYQVTVTLTDSSGSNSVSHAFAWTVASVVDISAPTTVPGTSVGGTVAGVQGSFVCPNAPCTITATGLPGGITLAPSSTSQASGRYTLSGKVTGSASTYTPQLKITDAKGKTATASFSWPVVAAPSIVNPGNKFTTLSWRTHNYSLALSSSCPLGGCTFSVTATTPSGPASNVSVSSNGTVTVSNASRTTYTITVSITDSDASTTSQTFTWTFS